MSSDANLELQDTSFHLTTEGASIPPSNRMKEVERKIHLLKCAILYVSNKGPHPLSYDKGNENK